MNKKILVAALAVALGAGYSLGALAQVKPEVQVGQRQGALKLFSKYYGPLGQMASGKAPFDIKVVARNAAYLDTLSHMPWDNFTPDTQGEKTRALPDVYKEPAKFKAAQEKLQADVSKLVSATKGGNEASVKAAIADVGKACGNCHDNFRAKQ